MRIFEKYTFKKLHLIYAAVIFLLVCWI